MTQVVCTLDVDLYIYIYTSSGGRRRFVVVTDTDQCGSSRIVVISDTVVPVAAAIPMFSVNLVLV